MEAMNIDDIKSNQIWQCLYCSETITIENYSGWESFTDDGETTQPICKFCNMTSSLLIETPKEIREKI